MDSSPLILPARDEDTSEIARLRGVAFPRDDAPGVDRQLWVSCVMQSYPLTRYYVARDPNSGGCLGYIQWRHLGGFRRDRVLELEQLAVAESWRGRGVGSALIRESLANLRAELESQGCFLHRVLVSTATTNEAQRLYRRELSIDEALTIHSLYGGNDEVLLVGTYRAEKSG